MVSRTPEQPLHLALLRTSWETQTFVHWRVRPALIQALLPPGLTVDEYDGSAWIGLTPFVMSNMRPLGAPSLLRGSTARPNMVPRSRINALCSTPETNLRTYVRAPDGRPGLWFLALEIGSLALATALRAAVGAPYHRARLTVEPAGGMVTYTGSRTGKTSASYHLEVRVGHPVEPSDLAVWLTSRWRAYTRHVGQLVVTPVAHEPWPLRNAQVVRAEQSLTQTVGLELPPEPDVVHFSDGVRHVRIGPPARVR